MQYYLGIDWGGTYIKAGLIDSRGLIVKKRVYASGEFKKKRVFINKLQDLVDSFYKFKVKGIGIGAPGIIDIEKGFIYYLPNIPGWKNFPLKSTLSKRLKIPVFVDNDANIFALAEARLGQARGLRRALFFTLGTGLGSAVIIDGKILTGKTSASELGHMPITLDGTLCGCGGRGCIQTFVGNKYLLGKYKKLTREKIKIKEAKDIFERALRGEKEALAIWKEFSESLGMFLAGMINIFNPERIIFGGGVSGAFKLFKPLVWEVIRHQAMWPQIKGLRLVKSKLKDAGIIGAALLAKEALG